uniref:T-box-containing protein 2-like n=1 Tax=Ciona intestinalis TaxID=7719 RepID=UPI0002B8D998|nr:T-box-containing protein 2-like [Ciona intestinalis]|eukprot:XP_002126887.2 T-box-containing protein 2-like [Ciona intestinalis]
MATDMRSPTFEPKVHLQDWKLWEQFSAVQTEMIVTKTGRRMFPGYRIKMSGMDPNAQYCVLMDISSVDENRYKFQHGEWVVAGRGEPQVPQRFYLHPNSPCSGHQWMKEIISFHKVKLTNSCGNSADGKFLIHSMHRYQPRIHIVRTDDVNTLHLQPMSTFAFPQTAFVTVTAYQNGQITKLKIANNPFARGFREDGAKTKKRKSQVSTFTDQQVLTKNNQRYSPEATTSNLEKRMKFENVLSGEHVHLQPTAWYQSTNHFLPADCKQSYSTSQQTVHPQNHNGSPPPPYAFQYSDVSPCNNRYDFSVANNPIHPQNIQYYDQQPPFDPVFPSHNNYVYHHKVMSNPINSSEVNSISYFTSPQNSPDDVHLENTQFCYNNFQYIDSFA